MLSCNQQNIFCFSKIHCPKHLDVRLPRLVMKEISLPSFSLTIIWFVLASSSLISSRPCLSLFLQPSLSVLFLFLSDLYFLPLSLLWHLILLSALLPHWPLSICVNNHLISTHWLSRHLSSIRLDFLVLPVIPLSSWRALDDLTVFSLSQTSMKNNWQMITDM